MTNFGRRMTCALLFSTLAPAVIAVTEQTTGTLSLSEKPTPVSQFPYPTWKEAEPKPGQKGRGPGINDQGRVECIARSGDTIYVGGAMLLVRDKGGDHPVTSLAAIDAVTGESKPFAPWIDGRVRALATADAGRILLVGGDFTHVGDKPCAHLAALDAKTGELLPTWNDPRIPDGTVAALLVRGDAVYVGGQFTEIAGQPRENLARLDLRSGSWTLNDTWTPRAKDGQPRRLVLTLAADAKRDRVLIGGIFLSLNDDKKAARLVAVDAKTGAIAQTFPTMPPYNDGRPFPMSGIIAMSVEGDTLFAGMGGPGGTALCFDLAARTRRWFYHTDGDVQAVAALDTSSVWGFHGDFVAPEKNRYTLEKGSKIPRRKLFLLNKDGKLQPWNPALGSALPKYSPLGVWTLMATPDMLYVGGDFTRVGEAEQHRFVRFSRLLRAN
ncbi:MAG: hypothetical protein V4671_31800 [Armatimonadota bacterium]